MKEDSQELAEFAKLLLSDPQHKFVFKGMENAHKVSRNLSIWMLNDIFDK